MRVRSGFETLKHYSHQNFISQFGGNKLNCTNRCKQFKMKHRTTLIILFLIGINTCFSQIVYTTERKDSTNIYFKSLEVYCQTIDKTELTDNKVYVEKDHFVTEKLPNEINGLDILYLDRIELKKTIKKDRGKITLIKIIPLRIKKTDFFVNVIPFEVSYKKRNFNYVNDGGLSVKYEFDSELNGLIFKAYKWDGI